MIISTVMLSHDGRETLITYRWWRTSGLCLKHYLILTRSYKINFNLGSNWQNVGNGFFHYACYVLLTALLRWAAGMGWLWDVAQR